MKEQKQNKSNHECFYYQIFCYNMSGNINSTMYHSCAMSNINHI